MTRDVSTAVFIGGMFLLLLAVAIFIPNNGITGRVVEPCTDCLALCDTDADCAQGVCCPTQWESGVCGLETECGRLLDYSEYQSLETYSDTVRAPPQREYGWGFFVPVILAIGIIAFLVFRKR